MAALPSRDSAPTGADCALATVGAPFSITARPSSTSQKSWLAILLGAGTLSPARIRARPWLLPMHRDSELGDGFCPHRASYLSAALGSVSSAHLRGASSCRPPS